MLHRVWIACLAAGLSLSCTSAPGHGGGARDASSLPAASAGSGGSAAPAPDAQLAPDGALPPQDAGAQRPDARPPAGSAAGSAAASGGVGGVGATPAAGRGGSPVAGAAGGDAGRGGSGSPAPTQASLDCPTGASYASPLPNNLQASLVQGGFGFIEGPLWLASRGVLLFSDMDFATSSGPMGPNSQIRRFTPPNSFDVFVASSGSNGLALANDGRVLAATHDLQTLSYFDPATGAREPRELRYQGKSFNSPNDLAVRSDGNVYFSDPNWQLGSRTSQVGMLGVYRVAPDGAVSLIDGTLGQPNGVALSPDERTLYVGSQGSEIYKFPLAADGSAGTRSTFATPGGSDGLGIDCAGNLYVASGGIQVFSPAGQKLGQISVPENPSNVAFGGPERKTLYITAGKGLYQIQLNVPGRAY
jgi:gluconolactonase